MANDPHEFIVEEYGEQCANYKAGCITCEVWKAFNELMAAGPLTEEEESLAMHWIDRYSSGIDEYPQLDRIIGRRAIQQGER